MDNFVEYESKIRSYSRSFPAVFVSAKNDLITDSLGKSYIDFFAGAGALNYGHNNSIFKEVVWDHLESNRLIHSLDMFTDVRELFLNRFNDIILKPRNFNYKVQFTGPTGTNAIEAALKLAMINTNRSSIICFTNGYHGHTMGAMSITGNEYFRSRLNMPVLDRHFAPFDGYFGEGINTAEMLRKMLSDRSSGVSVPAAIILETVQGEGGINIAGRQWLKEIREICDSYGTLLIVDDIQVGNGRTGDFFSFESADVKPDIVVMSKSIGGGLPLSLVLMKPELDVWNAGEHTGTFRSNNLSLACSSALFNYWKSTEFSESIKKKEQLLLEKLKELKSRYPEITFRGRGLIYGIEIPSPVQVKDILSTCFKNGLIIEVAGAEGNVLKILPPLTIEDTNLVKGLTILEDAFECHMSRHQYV